MHSTATLRIPGYCGPECTGAGLTCTAQRGERAAKHARNHTRLLYTSIALHASLQYARED